MSFEFYDICDIKVEVMTNYDKVWKFMTIYDWTNDTVGGTILCLLSKIVVVGKI